MLSYQTMTHPTPCNLDFVKKTQKIDDFSTLPTPATIKNDYENRL